MKKLVMISAILANWAAPAAAQTAVFGPDRCPAERALYEMCVADSEEVWRLNLVPAGTMANIASDLYLHLVTPQRGYWFTFAVSQGYGGISILPVTDPRIAPGPRNLLDGPENEAAMDEVRGYLRFMALNSALDVANDPPNRGGEAPPYILLPELGQGFWYNLSVFTDDPDADRDFMPRGLFKRSGCKAASPPEALP